MYEPFEDVSKDSPNIDVMMISHGFLYKKSIKPAIRVSRVEFLDNARKEYKQKLEEGGIKTSIFRNYF